APSRRTAPRSEATPPWPPWPPWPPPPEAHHYRRRMPVLSPLAHKRIQRFDERVDSVLDRVRGNPTADRVMYAASALGDHSLIWLILGALRGLRSEHDWKAA